MGLLGNVPNDSGRPIGYTFLKFKSEAYSVNIFILANAAISNDNTKVAVYLSTLRCRFQRYRKSVFLSSMMPFPTIAWRLQFSCLRCHFRSSTKVDSQLSTLPIAQSLKGQFSCMHTTQTDASSIMWGTLQRLRKQRSCMYGEAPKKPCSTLKSSICFFAHRAHSTHCTARNTQCTGLNRRWNNWKTQQIHRFSVCIKMFLFAE